MMMMIDEVRTNEILRRARLRRGLDQSQLAHRIGCDQSLISKWEGGQKTMKVPDLIRAAQALCIPGACLIGEQPLPEVMERFEVEQPTQLAKVG